MPSIQWLYLQYPSSESLCLPFCSTHLSPHALPRLRHVWSRRALYSQIPDQMFLPRTAGAARVDICFWCENFSSSSEGQVLLVRASKRKIFLSLRTTFDESVQPYLTCSQLLKSGNLANEPHYHENMCAFSQAFHHSLISGVWAVSSHIHSGIISSI